MQLGLSPQLSLLRMYLVKGEFRKGKERTFSESLKNKVDRNASRIALENSEKVKNIPFRKV